MPASITSSNLGRDDRDPELAGVLLDGLIDLCLRGDLDGLRRPRLPQAPGPALCLHGEGISACPLCGGPRRVYRIGGPDAAPRGHFCARCWRLDLVDGGGRPCGSATRRLEKFVRELPAAARPTSLQPGGRWSRPTGLPGRNGRWAH